MNNKILKQCCLEPRFWDVYCDWLYDESGVEASEILRTIINEDVIIYDKIMENVNIEYIWSLFSSTLAPGPMERMYFLVRDKFFLANRYGETEANLIISKLGLPVKRICFASIEDIIQWYKMFHYGNPWKAQDADTRKIYNDLLREDERENELEDIEHVYIELPFPMLRADNELILETNKGDLVFAGRLLYNVNTNTLDLDWPTNRHVVVTTACSRRHS